MSIMPSAEQAGSRRDSALAESVTRIPLHLRATDLSSRAVVSNVSVVHPGSGMVFIDFGFIEQQALSALQQAMQASQPVTRLDGRLECRVAMGVADIAQLAQQLQQVLASLHRPSGAAAEGTVAAMVSSPESPLQ